MQKNMQITANWSRSIPEVEFQYGGRVYFETGNSYISAANGDIWTKFGLLIDSDLLKAVTSKNTKPEVVLDMTSYFRSGCSDLDEIRQPDAE